MIFIYRNYCLRYAYHRDSFELLFRLRAETVVVCKRNKYGAYLRFGV